MPSLLCQQVGAVHFLWIFLLGRYANWDALAFTLLYLGNGIRQEVVVTTDCVLCLLNICLPVFPVL